LEEELKQAIATFRIGIFALLSLEKQLFGAVYLSEQAFFRGQKSAEGKGSDLYGVS
jgi:hypothetical protein